MRNGIFFIAYKYLIGIKWLNSYWHCVCKVGGGTLSFLRFAAGCWSAV